MAKVVTGRGDDGRASASDQDSDGGDTMDRNWSGVCHAAAVHSQALSDLAQEANDCREASDEEPRSPRPGIFSGTLLGMVHSRAPWWARRIAGLTSNLNMPVFRRPLNVVSGCTGVSSESFILEAGSDPLIHSALSH